MTVSGMAVAGGADLKQLMDASRSPAAAWYALRRFASYFWQRARYGKATWLVNGNALAGRLGRAAADAGVRLMLATPAESLIEQPGRVTGAVLRSPGGPVAVHARRGVVLSTGGFGKNTTLRARYFPRHDGDVGHGAIAAPGNTGDGLTMAVDAGAAVADRISQAGGLLPVSLVRHADGETGLFLTWPIGPSQALSRSCPTDADLRTSRCPIMTWCGSGCPPAKDRSPRTPFLFVTTASSGVTAWGLPNPLRCRSGPICVRAT